jgi:hypothetical protein
MKSVLLDNINGGRYLDERSDSVLLDNYYLNNNLGGGVCETNKNSNYHFKTGKTLKYLKY